MKASVRIVFLVLFGLALNVSISGAEALAGVLLLEWVWRAIARRDSVRWNPSPLDRAIVIFFLWTTATALIRGSTSVGDAISSQSAFLLFFYAASAIDDIEWDALERAFLIGAAIVGLWGVLQILFKINYRPTEKIYEIPEAFRSWPDALAHKLALRNDRAVGPRSHPLTYAEGFIPAIFVAFAAFKTAFTKRPGDRLGFFLRGLGVVLIGLGAIVAEGRAVWLGIGAGALVFSWFSGRRFFLRAMIALAILIPLALAASPKLRGRLMSSFVASEGTWGDQQSKATRMTLWSSAWQQIKERPVIGVGFKGAKVTAIDPISQVERTWTETHNMVLQVLLETGIVGTGLFVWIWILLAALFWRLDAKKRPAYLGFLAAFLVAGITESWPRDKEVAMIFWLYAGSGVNLVRRTDHGQP